MRAAVPFLLIAIFSVLTVTGTLLSAGPASAEPVRVVDDLGRTIALQQPAGRVIPLYGAFTEMLFAIGAGPRVIARTHADEFSEEFGKLPSVGTHMRPNVEMIVGLKPDLVVQSASRRSTTPEMERLQSTGIAVAVFSPNTFEEVFSAMERLGKLTGRENEAGAAVAAMRKRLEDIKSKLPVAGKPPRIFFEVRAEPLTAAGEGAIVNDILAAARAENVVGSADAVVRYSFEALLADDPDFYIVQSGPMNRNPAHPAKRPHFDQLRAVRDGKVIFVDELLYSRPGPRVVDAAEQLAKALYPERF